MPFFHEVDHFDAIRACLLAGDVQARVMHHEADLVKNRPASHSIEVKRDDGATMLWTNLDPTWAFTVIRKDGEVVVGRSGFPAALDPESVAKLIAVTEMPERDFATYDTETGQYVLASGEAEPMVGSGVPISAEDMASKLYIALLLTQEYLGDDVLPRVEGWSWYDAVNAYEAWLKEKSE